MQKIIILLIGFSFISTLAFAQQMPPGHPDVQQKERQVIVPDFVKGKWDAIVIRIEDRQGKETWEATVPIGKRLQLQGTPFEIEVQYFFPSFFMDDARITSVSNDPHNPAAKIVVYEDAKKIHDGWIFAAMPEVHAFNHPRYGLLLVRGVEAQKQNKK